MEYDRLKKRYFLELQEQLARSERRHAEEVERLSQQLSQQIRYNNTLLEHLQTLEHQLLSAQSVVTEAKKLLAKTAVERDNAIEACERLQAENQDILSKLATINQERDEQADENKTLALDNKLFRDELLKVKEDIAKYKFQLEKNEKDGEESSTRATEELLENQHNLYAEIETLRDQLAQLNQSVSRERDRVEVLDLQLKKERASLSSALDSLKQEQEKHNSARDECTKWASQFATRDNEAKSLALDVDFLQNELKTAHKQAANYALERDEKATMCDALSSHSKKLGEKIGGLEGDIEDVHKEAESLRERYENDIQLLKEENGQLLAEMHSAAQGHKADQAQKAQEFEEMRHSYEESMRDYCATLTQQCASIQATLQEELRRILAEKAGVVQVAREEKVALEAQLALNGSKLATTETLAREMEARYKAETDSLKRERDWLSDRVEGVQNMAVESYENFEGQIRECKELCVTLMSHYNSLLSAVSPLPSVIQSMSNDQHAQIEVSLGQIQNLEQQYIALTQQLERVQDEKQMLDVLLEEEKTKSLMFQESNSNIQHMLQAAQSQAAVAQELSIVVDGKTQEINALRDEMAALQDELLQQRANGSALLAKLDVAHCQLQIVNEENEKSLSAFAETQMQHSHQVAELEEKARATQTQLQAALVQRDAAARDIDMQRRQLEEARVLITAQATRAAADATAQDAQGAELAAQAQELERVHAQVSEAAQALADAKAHGAQAQSAVLALQEQRKQLQSENIELKEELEHLYRHQQLLTSLQQQHPSPPVSSEPRLDASIAEALRRQNRLIEDKCRRLQDTSFQLMKDFALPVAMSPDLTDGP